MANEQLHLTKLLAAVSRVLNAFNFPIGSSIIDRAAAIRDDISNNGQLLANLKEELAQLPSLTTIDISGEMRFFIQTLIESIRAAKTIDRKFITRSINKLYTGFEPFARNEVQHTALIEMQIAKEDVLGIEPRHRIAHKRKMKSNEDIIWQEEPNDENLHMTRELQAANY